MNVQGESSKLPGEQTQERGDEKNSVRYISRHLRLTGPDSISQGWECSVSGHLRFIRQQTSKRLVTQKEEGHDR